MMKKYFFGLLLILVLLSFSEGVYAQSKPGIVIQHIVADASLMGPSPKPGSGVIFIDTLRDPTVKDVIDAMNSSKKVTVVIWLSNDTARWPHAVRVVAINLTSYNGTNADNQTTIFNDAEIYDPTTNTTYNLTFSYIYEKNDTGYLSWGRNTWALMRDVITMHKIQSPRSGGPFFVVPFDFVVSLISSRKISFLWILFLVRYK